MFDKPTVVIIRGIPGSGKSTTAKKLMEGYPSYYAHVEADMFFEDGEGNYNFNPKLLNQAHAWCFAEATRAVIHGKSVIVSNTFVFLEHMRPYIELAKTFDIDVVIVECHGEFQNTHGVPTEVVDRMKSQWEEYSQTFFGREIPVVTI